VCVCFFADLIIVPDGGILDDATLPPLPPNSTTDGAGANLQYDKRYMMKLEAMKRAGRQMKDLSIVVLQKMDGLGGRTEWQRRRERLLPNQHRQIGTGRLRLELNQHNGTIYFDTGGTDGLVEICLQSMSASSVNPKRAALDVSLHVQEQAEDAQTPPGAAAANKKNRALTEGEQLAKMIVPAIQQDIMSMERNVKMIINNADYAKEQEIDFHMASVNMNRATKYWPMIHITVLFIAGFTQANHIVSFFKERHIF
jgi:hypothetical protein